MSRRPKYRDPFEDYSEEVVIYYPLKEYYLDHSPDIDYKYIAFNPLHETLYMPLQMNIPSTSAAIFKAPLKKTIKITREDDGFQVFFPNDATTSVEHSIVELYASYCILKSGLDQIWKGEFDESLNAIFWGMAFKAAGRRLYAERIIFQDFCIENLIKEDLLVDSELQSVATFAEMTSSTNKTSSLSTTYSFENVLYGDKKGKFKVINSRAIDTIDQYISGDRYEEGKLESVMMEEFGQKDDQGKLIQDVWYYDCHLKVTTRGKLYIKIFDSSLITKLRRSNCLTSGFAHKWGLKARTEVFREVAQLMGRSSKVLLDIQMG